MKGRWCLGLVSGFLFGLMLGVTLFLFGVMPLHSEWLWILPLLGIVLGLVMAAWAPFGSGESTETAAADTSAAAAPPPTPVDPTLENDVVPSDPSDGAPTQPDDE